MNLQKIGKAQDKEYIEHVRGIGKSDGCAICGSITHIEVHHHADSIPYQYHGGMGQKSTDYSCVAICQNCHQKFHHGLGNTVQGRWNEKINEFRVAALVSWLCIKKLA